VVEVPAAQGRRATGASGAVRLRLWIPPNNVRKMSTTGSIVLWAFFWWILLPVYMLYAVVWIATVVIVNVVMNTAILSWMLALAVVSAARNLSAARRTGG